MGHSTRGPGSGSNADLGDSPYTTLPPHGLDPDLSCVLCYVTTWIRILDPDRGSRFNACVERPTIPYKVFQIEQSYDF